MARSTGSIWWPTRAVRPNLLLRPDFLDCSGNRPLPNRPSNLGTPPRRLGQAVPPEFDGLVELSSGTAATRRLSMAARSDPGFVGVIGLPLLRLGEYGGNATDFWFRYPPS
jgi:hypothetical protein